MTSVSPTGSTRPRVSQTVLLVASLCIYAAVGSPFLAAVLVILAGTTFLVARGLSGADGWKAHVLLTVGIGSNLLVLGTLKYAAPALSDTYANGGWLRVMLPATAVGVSYYVLQAIAYLIDVRRGNARRESSIVAFTLSLAYFPKILQGPIERCQLLVPQLNRPISFDYENARRGLILVALGLVKKWVIADRLAAFVSGAFANPQNYQGPLLMLAVYSYAFQIYFDFSGYTDIALGAARVMGVTLTDNFDRPYWSSSVPEFWRRWHITLSNWLRDYLFLPGIYKIVRRLDGLPLRSVTIDKIGYASAALTTMAACGVWHGPRLTFLAWGLVHGFYLAASTLTRKSRDRLWKTLPRGWRACRPAVALVGTFHLVAAAWVLFRAETLQAAWWMFDGIARGGLVPDLAQLRGSGLSNCAVAYAGIAILLSAERLASKDVWIRRLVTSPVFVRWPIYYAAMLMVVFASAPEQSQFIYAGF
jgi:alginate O-acetyltransferase complex protein AlgI